MSDTIGRIAVPTVINSSQTFPLTTQYPFGFSVERPVIVHRFGSLDAKQEQRYYVGIGPRKFQFKRPNLGWTEANQIKAFWESMQGPWKAFTYTVPNPDGTTTSVLVTFEQVPISFEYLRNAVQVGLNFIEVVDPTAAPSYTISSTCTRFPSSTLSTALLSEVQQIVPLLHIRVRESAVPDIYLSDRRVTVGGQLHLPRLVSIGEPGSDVLISQDIKGTSDNVRFTFGNGDRVMTQLANDTDLKYAEIDLCLFHVNSRILLQLWKGVIQNFTSDGTPVFPVTCSDGFFQIMNQYPERQVSRQCWKTYNDGVNCPWATRGHSSAAVTAAGGDPTSCDYYLESANGCQVHGMSPYFGGHQADPQGVVIKDDSTGFLGFGRNTVTATSIISDTVWGLALPEIWCNSGGNPLFAYLATAMMVDYRDESGYADSLGILGVGPLGGFTASMVVTNADGYRYVVAPMVDGYLWQGLQVNGNLNITKYQPGYGLRYIYGSDPAVSTNDYFSLGQGSPQVWEPNVYAAGTAACEIRIVKSTTIQPSTPDQHQMTVPIDYGMWGWTWDQSGNRTAVRGLINPFWIAVNMLLRAMGLYGDPSTGSNPAGGSGPSSSAQLATFVLPSLIVGDGSGAAEIAADTVAAILGGGTETQFQFQGILSSQKPFRDWMTEVLNCCLGFYTWEFGQLKLGCRINASAADAYTLANCTHSVGVTRQYCGQVGKQDNCRVAVSLSVATWSSSLPIAYRLYLPKEWAEDAERRGKTEVPVEVGFQTKPEIALDQIRAAVAAQVNRGIVLADAAYGINTEFREGLTQLGLQYVVGVQSSMTVWEPGKQPLPPKTRGKMGRPPRLLQRATDHQPVSVKQLAMNLPSTAFKEITWREGAERKLHSRFAAVRVRPAHRDYWKAEPHAEEWLLIEWPRGETEPTKYWISTLASDTRLKALIKMAKQRWIIERDYQELKQELGLGHFEGRNWRGFHHHATLCIAAYGFLVAERNRFSPSARAGHLGFVAPRPVPHFSPRGSPRTPRAA